VLIDPTKPGPGNPAMSVGLSKFFIFADDVLITLFIETILYTSPLLISFINK
jgi:hypothetical protein